VKLKIAKRLLYLKKEEEEGYFKWN